MSNTPQAKAPFDGAPISRAKWRYSDKAKEFHASHGYARFAPAFHSLLEGVMCNSALSSDTRTLAGLIRFGPGQQSDVAMDGPPRLSVDDREPEPLTQVALAQRTGQSTGAVSECCTLFRGQGILRPSHPGLYLEGPRQPLFPGQHVPEQQSPLESNSHSVNSSLFVRYKDWAKSYLATHPEIAIQFEQVCVRRDSLKAEAQEAAKAVDRLERTLLLAVYRDEKRKWSRNGSAKVESNSHTTDRPFTTPPESIQTPGHNIQAVRIDSENKSSVLNRGPAAPVRTDLQREHSHTSSSSSVRDEVTTTTAAAGKTDSTTPPPAPSSQQTQQPKTGSQENQDREDRAAIATALGNKVIEEEIVSSLLRDCRQRAPDVTGEEIAIVMRAKAPLAKINTAGFLQVAVPKFFARENWCEDMAKLRAVSLRSGLGQMVYKPCQIEEARKIWDDPKASGLDRMWAAKVLGIDEDETQVMRST